MNNIMQRLFHEFEKAGILYLHFKSNTNIGKSFRNEADFDVLIDKSRIIDIEKIIVNCNGKRHNPVHIGNYPGVDNWLIFDENDGNIFHLHLHYQLVTGKPLVKDYVLPWNEILFSTRIKDPQFGIFVTDPNLELVMLATRSVLKAKPFDFFKKMLGLYTLPKSMKNEWDDLYHKSSEEKLELYINVIFPNYASKLCKILIKEHLASRDFLTIHRIIRKEMKLHRRFTLIGAVKMAYLNKIESLSRKFLTRKMGGMYITKKTSLQGGLIIGFIGVDGAGKSTVSNEIARWIGRKIECKRFYMGIGDGKTTLFASLLKRIKGIIENKSSVSGNNLNTSKEDDVVKKVRKISTIEDSIRYIRKFLKLEMIISVEKNNYKKIQKMHQYRLNGGICILDRFPQIEIIGQNDGPKVPVYANILGENVFVNRKKKTENKYLGIVKQIKPDIIFRLNISVDTCISRKPENKDREMFARKIKDLNKLTFQGTNIVDVNAEAPYDIELLEIKKHLWQFI